MVCQRFGSDTPGTPVRKQRVTNSPRFDSDELDGPILVEARSIDNSFPAVEQEEKSRENAANDVRSIDNSFPAVEQESGRERARNNGEG